MRGAPELLSFALVAAACGGRSIGQDVGEAAAEPVDDRLQPFELGRTWQYRQFAFDPALPVSCDGPFASSVSERVVVQGEAGWIYHPSCLKNTVTMFLDGDSITAGVDWTPRRLVYASPPVVDGATWDGQDGLSYVWRDVGTVTVEAGTFDRCWQRSRVADENENIVLCRGVGLVATSVAQGNFYLELSSKNF